jgi:hypothetical protein
MSESRSRNAAAAASVGLLRGGRILPLAVPALDSEEHRRAGARSARLKVPIHAVDIYRMAENPEPPKTDQLERLTSSLDRGHQITNM